MENLSSCVGLSIKRQNKMQSTLSSTHIAHVLFRRIKVLGLGTQQGRGDVRVLQS